MALDGKCVVNLNLFLGKTLHFMKFRTCDLTHDQLVSNQVSRPGAGNLFRFACWNRLNQWQNFSACQPKFVVRGLNFGPLWQRAHLPNWGVHSAADTALFVAILHQKHIRVKLNNELLTNEIEEIDTLKGGGSHFRGIAHVPDRSVRVPGVAHPCSSRWPHAEALEKCVQKFGVELFILTENVFSYVQCAMLT